MKTFLAILMVLAVGFLVMGQSSWHLRRNQHNKLPTGKLTHDEGDWYKDEAGLKWQLQPAIKNKFHQPSKKIEPVENPYPNVDKPIKFDPKNPNLKFLSKTKQDTSYEAILQPDGTYLTKGKKQGTYNYGHPSGFWGSTKHLFLDVVPHFVNSNYRN